MQLVNGVIKWMHDSLYKYDKYISVIIKKHSGDVSKSLTRSAS